LAGVNLGLPRPATILPDLLNEGRSGNQLSTHSLPEQGGHPGSSAGEDVGRDQRRDAHPCGLVNSLAADLRVLGNHEGVGFQNIAD
jgi:hypothetical protein